LLIVRALDRLLLADLLQLASELELGTLVEVHNEEELDAALSVGATLVGINNRDLATFHTSLETTERLVPRLPQGVLVVAESGIETRAEIERLERIGVHAFLIGEALVRAADPVRKLQELLD
jgi:indole-3-glycerol phosphate synthase